MMVGYGISGRAHDFFAYNAGKVWNGNAYVDFVDADYVSYRIAAAETGSTGQFTAADPPDASYYELRLRAGSLSASVLLFTERVGVAGGDEELDVEETNLTIQ